MTIRLTILELRRTWLPWLIAFMLLAAHAMSIDGMDPQWPGLVGKTVIGHRSSLFLLWPLALTIGVIIGRRDGAAGTSELLGATSRRPWSRLVLRATLLCGGLAAVYLAALADTIGLAVLDADTYWPSAWPWSLLVGALGIAAGGLLGLALGRALPSLWTIPLSLLGATVVLAGLEFAGRSADARVLLLDPSYVPDSDVTTEFLRVGAQANAGQAIWFTALGLTGFLLYTLPYRPRRAALIPAGVTLVVGLAAALLVLPSAAQAVRPDPGATALVCAEGTPRVCVTRAYATVLPELTGPAREALTALGRLPNAPVELIQDTHYFGFAADTLQEPSTVRVQLTIDSDGGLVTGGGRTLVESLLDGAGTLVCAGYTTREAESRQMAARAVAAAWLLNRTDPPEAYVDEDRAVTTQAWDTLHALPADQQVARVAALRAAGLQCRADLFEVLTGTA
ncbi:hypothetical protein [Catenuloplanes japonicus]|uniref:hypothetical protein n=1 Tax=Catenuloplanes japonicus TaxID=33876 RepID=UPI00052594B6|nr:hypothetical protein [Catenuloplanes japonicus]